MEMFILMADTEDWYGFGEDVEGYLEKTNRFLHFLPDWQQEMFRSNIHRWSHLVRSSYMNFRGKIKDIAFRNHDKLGLTKKFPPFQHEMTRDQVALMTDDDDLFNPGIVDEVRKAFEEHPEVEVVHWDSWQYHMVYLKEMFCVYNLSRVGSNSFAIRGGNNPWLYTWGAHRKVEQEEWLPANKKYFIPYKALTLWNIHPASYWQRTNFPLDSKFYKIDRAPRPAMLDWAAEEIDAIYDVLNSLVPKS